ncbi:MAG: M23 family metallopeptidase [Saprospirales bacterium]|nr:M23 family metallopeptidase [Saprospirales bacterium]MBK8923915.1 M23 family metallopeptidase [Saprospirales bacterium]
MWTLILRVFFSLAGLLPVLVPGVDKAAVRRPPPEAFQKDYFRMPVGLETIRLSGTFGELRSNHFHTGIDISSATGSIGQPIYAAADGFIDRIRVQEGGYGKALYIKHPNGYTTLYAHLDKFSAAVERFVKEAQYKRERFEVDLYPADGAFKVEKGEQIGRMGNTGSSEGPHLHFEIRRSADQKALNPLLFGLPIPDRVPPELRDMKVYILNEQREVLSSLPFPIERRPNGAYGVKGDTVRIPAWRVGFGLKAFDQSTGNTHNKNGLFALTLLANGQPAFQWHAAEIDFDESRYLNAHADYAAHERYGAWFHRCFVLPGDRLSNYARTETLGAVPLYKEKPTRITLQASDSYNNISEITFWVLRAEPGPQTRPPHQFELPFLSENHVDLDGFSLTIPKGALYETLFFQYSASPPRSGWFAPVHHIHHDAVPLHRYCTLRLRPDNLPESLRPKAVIARIGNRRPVNCGGKWTGEFLETRVRDFGDYSIVADTTPPTIKPLIFSADMRRKATIALRISDDFRTEGNADGLSYRGTVDGKWILFEYDQKHARLTHRFDGRIAAGQHTLRLAVTDDRGNTAVFERNFIR